MKVYWNGLNGYKDKCGETNNPHQWLEDNNKRRYEDVVCCEENGYIDDNGNYINGEKAHKQKKCSCIEIIEEFDFIWEEEGL